MRLEVTRSAELAVRTIAALSAPSTRLKSGDLAATLGTTRGFLTQVINPLVKAGWVRSDPGPTGGYSLTSEGRGRSVLDVIELVDGPTATGQCVVVDRPCDSARACILHDAWSRARTELRAVLAAQPAAAARV